MTARITRRSRISEVMDVPIGHDAVMQLLRQTRRSPNWLRLIGWFRLGWFDRLAGCDLVDAAIRLLNQHADDHLVAGEDVPAWWKEAVVYQVYPRSFADSDGDGVGDLPGLIARLDYLAELGVDCLWLSPIFDSPNEDLGYDVRDYKAIMAEMGTLADADALIVGCHERGIRVLFDLVMAHTSIEHAWAQAALEDPDGTAGAFYFFRESGDEPNNWRSIFSGSAWRYFPEIDRWALHTFAEGQLDLNWDNPAVRDAAADVVSWWLERGVDGFRLDVINLISKSDGLPDGNEIIGEMLEYRGIEHYFYGPRLHEYLAGLRRDGFTRRTAPASTVRVRRVDGTLGEHAVPDPVGAMVGEVIGIGAQTGRLLTRSNRGELDLTFNFDVLDNPGHSRFDEYRFDPNHLKEHYLNHTPSEGNGDWISLFLDNHDNPRMLSKVANGTESDPVVRTAVAKLLATMQLTLRGTPFLFQGQEVGAVDQSFTGIGDLRDVESLNRYCELLANGVVPERAWREILAGTRDHARVPLRWTADGGFTTGEPWLPGHDTQSGFNVDDQRADPASVWSWYRDLIALRRSDDAFTYGTIEFWCPRKRRYFGWVRGERWLVELNLSPRSLRRPRPPFDCEPVIGEVGRVLPPWGASISQRTMPRTR